MTSLALHLLTSALLLHYTAAQTTCTPGEFLARGRCYPCPRNTFSSIPNQTVCTPCPPGTVSPRGSRAFQLCAPCRRGTFFDTTVPRPLCTRCPVNTYTDTPGSSTCTPCPGASASPEGSRRLRDCKTCSDGLILQRRPSRPFHVNCGRCPSGQTAAATNSERCVDCPAGTFRGRGNIFFVCHTCPPGRFAASTGSSQCERCPVNTFQSRRGSRGCIPCPRGSSTHGETGQPLCRPNCVGTPGCSVKSCPPGQELDAGGVCKRCPKGRVNPVRSTTPCQQCLSGGEAVPNEARTRCVCMPGYTKRLDGNCGPCPENTSNEDGGKCVCVLPALFEGKCRCPPLTVQFRNRCVPCDPRIDPTCEDCEDGEFSMTFNRTSFRCERCPRNTFKEFREFGFSRCRPCPGDSTSKPGSYDCDCGAGRGIQSGRCAPCRPGSFQPRRRFFRSRRCQLCFDGEIQDEFGATKCKNICPFRLKPVRVGATKCLDECPPNSSRNVPLNQVCRCDRSFRNTGTKEDPVCIRSF